MLDPDAKKGRAAQVLAVAVNTEGNLLASGGKDNFLRLWDTRSGEWPSRSHRPRAPWHAVLCTVQVLYALVHIALVRLHSTTIPFDSECA